MTTSLITVPFHGNNLFIVNHNNEPYAPMKAIVEGMGLAWQSQLAKLRNNEKRWGITEIVIPSDGGKQEAICLPVRKLAGWMASISPNKVNPEIREKVIMYQNECDDALYSYWTQGIAINTRAVISPEQKAALHDIVATRAGNNRKVFAQMWSRHNKHFRIAKYEELLAIHFDDAVEYLETMELTTPKASTEALPDFLGTREAMKELTQTMSQYMDSLRVMMQGAGCAMPQFPLIDTERYAQGVMLQLLMSQNFSLSFNHDMQLQLTALPKATLSVDPTDSRSIKNLVPRIPTAQLAEVAQAMIAEMGKRTSRLLA